jgi:hypothetical protein
MSDESKDSAKKLIIDEDWKSQVEAEKEAARHAGDTEQATSAQPSPDMPLPAANLTFLLGTLYLQGAIALGLLPHPVSQKAGVELSQAQHAIDMLAMLQQKTEGNRTPEESAELDAALHELRLTYIAVKDGLGKQTF